MGGTSAVEVSHLSYKYPSSNTWALRNINLQIPKGKFVVLIGPSGSGKSTLLTLLRGFYQEFGGQIRGQIKIFGEDIAKVPISSLGQKIGIVFQNPALQLHQLSVIDEVASALTYQGFPYNECLKRAKRLVDRFLGKEFYNLSPNELSAGQQQKVALAASLSQNANILLLDVLDEPFSFLDETAIERLTKFLQELLSEGKTIIIATHNIGRIAEIATELVLINNGKIILKGKPKDVLYSQDLEKVLPPPVFIQVAKKLNLPEKPLNWDDLSVRINLAKIRPDKSVKRKCQVCLSLRGISFNYPESNKGLKEVNLEIARGRILGIIGTNGCGKTTLAKIILGLLKPSRGAIFLDGKDITRLPTNKRAKDIGYATQNPSDMFFESNLINEVAAGPKFLKLPNPYDISKKMLRQFHLWQYQDKNPDSISGGEKSRLGIADVLANGTKILLLDEPEFGLDPKNWSQIVNVLLGLKKQGKTIIIITQDLESAFFTCDEIAVMKDGKILGIGPPVLIYQNKSLFNQATLPTAPFSFLLNSLPNGITIKKNDFLNLVERK